MDKHNQILSQTLSKVLKYTKNLKQNVGIQPILSSQTALSHQSNQYYEYPYSFTSSAAFHKSKSKKQSVILSREISPKNIKTKHKSKQSSNFINIEDPFNMSCKHPILKKQFQSQNQRDTVGFNRTENKIQIKHLANLLNGSMGSKEITKKSGHSYTYTHLNDAQSQNFSEVDSSFYTKQQQKITKFRHSKSPTKQRHIEHNNTSYADDNHNKISFINRKKGIQRSQSQPKVNSIQVGNLLKEINRLQGIIESYQSILMKIKHRYLQLEDKLSEKVLNDHYIDVLKKHVQQLQDKNHHLNLTIKFQKEALSKCQGIFIQKITQIRQYYQKSVQQNIVLAKQNEYLKKILLIATSKQDSKNPTISIQQNVPIPNSFLNTMTKNVQQFCNKWK